MYNWTFLKGLEIRLIKFLTNQDKYFGPVLIREVPLQHFHCRRESSSDFKTSLMYLTRSVTSMAFQQINWLLYCNGVVYRLPKVLGTCENSVCQVFLLTCLSTWKRGKVGGRLTLHCTSRVIDEGKALSTSKVGEKEGAQLSIRAGGRCSIHKTY